MMISDDLCFQPVSLALDALLRRASTDDVHDPAPQGAQLARILSAGLCAPDHGKLRPWRYVVIHGDARSAFAQQVVAAIERQEPDTSAAKKEKRFRRFSTMPAIIALGMHLRLEHKVPVQEQEMAVAAGAMNVLNALHLEGFGGIWISGAFCSDRILLQSLGLEAPHRLAGFLFVGTPAKSRDTAAPHRPAVEPYMAEWTEGGTIRFAADGEKG